MRGRSCFLIVSLFGRCSSLLSSYEQTMYKYNHQLHSFDDFNEAELFRLQIPMGHACISSQMLAAVRVHDIFGVCIFRNAKIHIYDLCIRAANFVIPVLFLHRHFTAIL